MNWERNTVWVAREIVFELIKGNPNYNNNQKPTKPSEVFRIRDDKKEEERRQSEAIVTEDEINEIKKIWGF